MRDPIYMRGDIVTYKDFMGQIKSVQVVAREKNIKNGKPGFTGIFSGIGHQYKTGTTLWGYDDQIIAIGR